MKADPEQVFSVTLDDVELSVTFKANMDRPHDEEPEVYDICITLAPSDWLTEAVRQQLVERVWQREHEEAIERMRDHRDGPEYDPDEPRIRT